MKIDIIISESEKGKRIDKYLSEEVEKLKEYSREKIKKGIQLGGILLNNQKIGVAYKLKQYDKIVVDLEKMVEISSQGKVEYTKRDITTLKNMIIYEDSDILVIQKPKGVIVHSGSGTEKTLSGMLEKYYQEKSIELPGEEGRKGIVHRLDKDTTGLMVIAISDDAYANLVKQFKNREVEKKYITIVKNKVAEKSFLINLPIGRDLNHRHKMKVRKDGKEAKTRIETIYSGNNISVLDIELLTGRTHQIRVHMSYIKHPIIGDEVYSTGKNKYGIKGQVLQAYSLEFIHPVIKEKMKFIEEPYVEIQKILKEEKIEDILRNMGR